MAIVNINFKLYKAKALVNIKYDNNVVKEGNTVEIRESDIAELIERHYVEMIELPEKEEVNTTTTTTEPDPKTEKEIGEGNHNEEDVKSEGVQNTEGGE